MYEPQLYFHDFDIRKKEMSFLELREWEIYTLLPIWTSTKLVYIFCLFSRLIASLLKELTRMRTDDRHELNRNNNYSRNSKISLAFA